MKVAFLTTDNREAHRRYQDPEPYFGPAPGAVLEGFAMLGENENSEIQKFINEEIGKKDSGAFGSKNQETRTTHHKPTSFEIHVISCTQQPLAAPEKIAPNIWYHSLHVPKIGWLRTGYQGCIRAVRRKLREINPDIVHGQGTERDCSISAVFSGYPNVLTIHGNMGEIARKFFPKPLGFYWITANIEKLTLPLSNGVLCNSDYTRSIVEHCCRKTWRIDNPIRSIFFDPLSNEIIPCPLPRLVNVGSIVPWKRPLELLKMAARIHQSGFSFEMRFIGPCGDGDYSREFLSEIQCAEKIGYASYLGGVGIKELIREMDAASGMCHFPSEEAFGLVVAEGLSRNLKFFGSRVGGIPGIVEGVEGAELADPDDFEGLEHRIMEWLKNGAPRNRFAQENMRERFHPEVIARKHLEIYREVLAI